MGSPVESIQGKPRGVPEEPARTGPECRRNQVGIADKGNEIRGGRMGANRAPIPGFISGRPRGPRVEVCERPREG